MNAQWTMRNLLILLLAVGASLAVMHSYLPPTAASHYEQCSTLAVKDPAAALTDAKLWRNRDSDSIPAQHCEAMALYGLKNFDNAALLLRHLTEQNATANPALAKNLLPQMVTAYRAAGGNKAALAALDDLLAEDKLPVGLRAGVLTQEATLDKQDNRPLQAMQEVDEALSLAPKDPVATGLQTDLYKEISPAR